MRAFHTHFWDGVTITDADTNGQPSVLLSKEGTTFAVVTVVAGAEGIDQVLWMMNPDKLAAVSRSCVMTTSPLASSSPSIGGTTSRWRAC